MEKALEQYVNLFREHEKLIREKSAHGFNLLRHKALESLEAYGLPPKGSENYEVTDLGEMIAPDFGLNIMRIPLDVNPAEGFKCGIPHLSTSLFFMLDDLWAESKGARANLPEGVEIGPLSSYLHEDGEALRWYGKAADMANPLVALNSLLAQEGIFIKVKKGVRVEKPLQIVNLLENTMPLMAVRRLVIVLEEDSSLSIVTCDHTSSPSQDLAALSVAEIFAGPRSRLDIYDMEESTAHTRRLSALYLKQEEGSDVQIENFTLHNGQTRNEYHCDFDGTDAILRLYGIGIEGGSRVLDNYSRINHNVERCRSEELFKYIVDDEAKGAFEGCIYVAPGAMKTEAYQSNRNLVGSENARMFSKPWLEIYNDDVKCSHGSATGQLDAMQLFYLRSRGLDEAEATRILKQAFVADVVEGVRLPLLKDRLRNIVDRRFAGDDLTCGECDACS